MIKKASIVLNSIVSVISLILLFYTFFAKSHLESHAQDYLAEKTLEHSKPIFNLAKSGLDNPISAKLIPPDQKARLEEEISSYEGSPIQYMQKLVGQKGKISGDGKVAKIKNKIIDYYNSVLSELMTDLRIFSVSNLVAGLFGLFITLHPKLRENAKSIAFSFVVFIAVVMCSYDYIQGLSFLKILFKWHLGWWYPAGIAMTIVTIYSDYSRHIKILEQMADKESIDRKKTS